MRLKYTSNHPTDPDPKIQEWIDKLVASQPRGDVSPLFRTVLLSPAFARGFAQFFGTIRWQSSVPADLMELAMCRVAALNSAAFEWMHHEPLLRKAGLSQRASETVRAVMAGHRGEDGEGDLTRKQWAVMQYTDAMTKEVRVTDEVFAAAKDAVNGSDRTMLELTITIAGYNMVSRMLVALDVAELKDVPVGRAKL